MPGQAELLVSRMKDSDNIDYENDWKVITIFIGGNDLCDFCEDKVGICNSFQMNIFPFTPNAKLQTPLAKIILRTASVEIIYFFCV